MTMGMAAALGGLGATTLAAAPVTAGPLHFAGGPPAAVAGAAQAPGATVALGEQAFSMNLLRLSGLQGRNAVLSPWSAALCVSMLQGAARGSTAAGIAGALGDGSLSSTTQAEGWKVLEGQISSAAAAGHIQLNAANRLWVAEGFPVRPSYVQWLAKWYAAKQGVFDGRNPAAAAAQINAWVAAQTRGQIKQLFTPAALADAVVVLANAVEMKASWLNKFDPSQTLQAPFYPALASTPGGGTSTSAAGNAGAAGGPVMVRMMDQADTVDQASISSSLIAVQLPYQGHQLAALVLMPRTGGLTGLEETLARSGFAHVLATLRSGEIRLELPRFTMQTAINLNQVLTSLGMGQAFGAGADLGALSPTSTHVMLIRQVARIQVDETGTKAAAATGTAIGATAMRPASTLVVINHPFLFVVRDVRSGVILFAAQVDNPAA
jgi:serpin B